MKTWFCKDTQKWVSEIPRAFWVGVYDYKTGEKLYSDDNIYTANSFLRSLHKKPYINLNDAGIFPKINDCRGLKFGTNVHPKIPVFETYWGKYTKYI